MECKRHNSVSMDLRSSEQEVVGRVDVNDVARHFWFQIFNLAWILPKGWLLLALKPCMVVVVV